MYSRYDLNPATIRELVHKLPPHAFDFMVEEWPDMLEIRTDKTDYIRWETKEDYPTEEKLIEDYGDYESLEEMEEDYWVTEFTDGWLIIE